MTRFGLILSFWFCIGSAFAQNFIIEQVHVYQANEGVFTSPRDVVIVDDSIAHVGKSRAFKRKGNFQIIRGNNGYLIPGLWDAHVHIRHLAEADMGLFVKNGVIGLRDMGGRLDQIDAFRSNKSSPGLPEIYTPGPILESANWLTNFERDFGKTDDRIALGSLEEVVPALDSLVTMGVDFVKIRSAMNRQIFEKIVEVSNERGLRLAGHIPIGVLTLAQAVEAGLSSVEHSVFMSLMEAPEVTRTSAFEQVKRFSRLTPTLITDSIAWLMSDETKKRVIMDNEASLDGRIDEISDRLHEYWKQEFMKLVVGDQAEMDMRAIVERFHGMSRQMAAMGVEMMAGTDSPMPMVFPGTSLHSEMIMMQEVLRMKPVDILKAATFNTPNWLGLEGYGAIEKGKVASLVLLTKNPLADIAHISAIAGVLHRGSFVRH